MDEATNETSTGNPLAVIPKGELWLHNCPEAKGAVLRGLSDSAAGRTVDGGDFTQFLDDSDDISRKSPI